MRNEINRKRIMKKMAEAVIPDDPRELLDEFQTAKLMKCSVYKLRRDRWAGGGVPFIKLSDHGAVRYTRQDVDARIAARRRQSTSDNGQNAA